MFQAANTDLFNPSVPKLTIDGVQNLLFPLQMKPVMSVKANWRIFIFLCPLHQRANGIKLQEKRAKPILVPGRPRQISRLQKGIRGKYLGGRRLKVSDSSLSALLIKQGICNKLDSQNKIRNSRKK